MNTYTRDHKPGNGQFMSPLLSFRRPPVGEAPMRERSTTSQGNRHGE